jgi:hypothetical protein
MTAAWGEDSLPTNSVDQSCAFCHSTEVTWLHPLDRELVIFRMFGRRHTLPHFWTLCERCEQLYRAGDDEAILRLAVEEGGWPGTTLIDFDEQVRQPFDVFRRADLGARPLSR